VSNLTAQLAALQAALIASTVGGPAPPALASDIDAFIRGIRRKARFVEMHMGLLTGVDWSQIDDIGRRPGGGAPTRLTITLSDASLTLEHSSAVVDHVYLAFDGLTAALVNITDTLARLLNLVYSLGIDPKRASLLAVRDRCSATSSLGIILHDVQHTDWLRKVRDLRGRCQHADVDEILISMAAPLSRREQPYVDLLYSWKSPAQATLIVTYAREAVQAAETCLGAAIGAILANPPSPMT
jgi:hypothetical protein